MLSLFLSWDYYLHTNRKRKPKITSHISMKKPAPKIQFGESLDLALTEI